MPPSRFGMHGYMDYNPDGKRRGQIGEKIEQLDKTAIYLQEKIDVLNKRLEDVIVAPTASAPKDPEIRKEERLVGLAMRLDDILRNIKSAVKKLDYITNNIEL